MDDDDHSPLSPRNYNPNARIMVTAIISISFVVVLISILHIYARCALRRQARQRATLRRLGFIQSAAIAHIAEPPKTGLDPTVIASLPKFVFKQTNHHNSNETETECAVCLSLLEDGDLVRTLPNCKHAFHVECIDQWFGSNSTCPICRTEAEPRLVPEPREGVAEAPPSAPPLEGTSDGAKVSGSMSTRLSSFRRMISRERSSRRISHGQSRGQELEGYSDLERQ